MKIVFITPSYLPNIGGVERHVEGITKLLSKKHQITIITEQKDQSQGLDEVSDTARVFRIPVSKFSEKSKKWQIWKWIDLHKRILDEADVIHVHDVMYWLYFYKITHWSKKIYITFHGWEGRYPIPIRNIIQHKINEVLAHKNICVGSFVARWYHTKPDDITYGATISPSPDDLGVSTKKSEPILLFVGRLDQDTGFSQCLNLYRKLRPELRWQLMVLGDGPLRHLVPPEVKLLGLVKDPEKYIKNADYIFASGYMAILESFAHQKIVLSSFNNYVREDYIKMHPMAKHIFVSGVLPKHSSEEAYNWASNQTWQKLANQYEHLWQKQT